jgi:putative chitinase
VTGLLLANKTGIDMVTAENLSIILPRCKDPDRWAFELESELYQYNITTTEQVASFLSQTGHESAHFNVLEENLNYSKDGLRKIFGKYFPTDELAASYARKPVTIASRVYGNRMGNGPEATQDGWNYRGRGLIQCTGYRNYSACSQFLFEDGRLVHDPDLLLEPKYAILSACWFWSANKLNDYADDVVKTTRIVNGGHHGLEDRQAIYNRAMSNL